MFILGHHIDLYLESLLWQFRFRKSFLKKCRNNIENGLIVSERIPNLSEYNDQDEDQTDHQDGRQDEDVGPGVKHCGNTKGINLSNI